MDTLVISFCQLPDQLLEPKSLSGQRTQGTEHNAQSTEHKAQAMKSSRKVKSRRV